MEMPFLPFLILDQGLVWALLHLGSGRESTKTADTLLAPLQPSSTFSILGTPDLRPQDQVPQAWKYQKVQIQLMLGRKGLQRSIDTL